ncbi:MAG: hypothetical protein HYV04_04025 [Deltaproteobacteria bacterium]|nr:hypothetical protein [Deltaproteobacteria bacterium]
MKNLVTAIATTFSIALLIGALGLGFLASWGQIDRNLHAVVALLAGLLAVGMHVRGRSGFDLLATLLLIIALGLGVMLSGGGVASATHRWAAIVAVIASAAAQIRNLVIGDVETVRIPEERESQPEEQS